MTPRRALTLVLIFGLLGMAFSGVLTYGELFAASPDQATCPTVGEPGTVLGYPACVYGFFMYAVIVALAAFGLRAERRRAAR